MWPGRGRREGKGMGKEGTGREDNFFKPGSCGFIH